MSILSKYSALADQLDQKTATAEHEVTSANAKHQAAKAKGAAWDAKTDPGYLGYDSRDAEIIMREIGAAESAEVKARKEFAVAAVKSGIVAAPLKIARGLKNLLNPAPR